MLNPKSGTGKALAIFQKTLRPLLEETRTPFKLVTTERPGHGRDIALTEDLTR